MRNRGTVEVLVAVGAVEESVGRRGEMPGLDEEGDLPPPAFRHQIRLPVAVLALQLGPHARQPGRQRQGHAEEAVEESASGASRHPRRAMARGSGGEMEDGAAGGSAETSHWGTAHPNDESACHKEI